MPDHSLDFIQFLIDKGHLKALHVPYPGCMVIFFNEDTKIIDTDVVTEVEPFAFQYEKDSATMCFYDSLDAKTVKECLVDYLQDPQETASLSVISE
jgi:hypothetical protein